MRCDLDIPGLVAWNANSTYYELTQLDSAKLFITKQWA